ncbi:hypothetical protein B9Z19DRAFT_1096475 [Tuber borchii]|uniref:Uncharacterized protein n=1 Tax=Tuber borchii TaxID=42251 RepID=A0A2T6ZBG9_TUBBO|nr:hypothetical protein B9Z19DRAFT_1096475 [Tuber borchii]
MQHKLLNLANRKSSREFPISEKSKTDCLLGSSDIVINTALEPYYALAEGQLSGGGPYIPPLALVREEGAGATGGSATLQ